MSAAMLVNDVEGVQIAYSRMWWPGSALASRKKRFWGEPSPPVCKFINQHIEKG